jgi:hypothetical protein
MDVFQEIVTRLPNQGFVAPFVALALPGNQRAVLAVNQEVDAVLALAASSVRLGRLDVIFFLRKVATQMLK